MSLYTRMVSKSRTFLPPECKIESVGVYCTKSRPELYEDAMGSDREISLQMRLPLTESRVSRPLMVPLDIETNLRRILAQDLSFDGEKTNYATHNLHAFAAKFPPQLPRLFMQELTRPGEFVLDPMVGSGTVLVEALLSNRRALGIDLDPLAILLSQTKTVQIDLFEFLKTAGNVLEEARGKWFSSDLTALERKYSGKAVEFFEYWFEAATIAELFALVQAIERVADEQTRSILQIIFSSTIIAKSGGVSLARDLAHSRPHKDYQKTISQSAFDLFQERLLTITKMLDTIHDAPGSARLIRGDARSLPLSDNSVDLIFTSPPYAANAIDYMRAHKFSLIWFGYPPETLSKLRSRYIGSELRSPTANLPSETANSILRNLLALDAKRAAVVTHYFVDMESVLQEMKRVLAPARAAVIVVGSSTIRGIDIEVGSVLAELAEIDWIQTYRRWQTANQSQFENDAGQSQYAAQRN